VGRVRNGDEREVVAHAPTPPKKRRRKRIDVLGCDYSGGRGDYTVSDYCGDAETNGCKGNSNRIDNFSYFSHSIKYN
jgi:hypothetical protein